MSNSNLKEATKHGTVQFPLGFYAHTLKEEPLFVSHHWHEEVELIYIEDGNIELEINMEKVEVKENTFYFMNSEELHSLIGKPPLSEAAIVFDLNLLSFEMFDYGQNKLIKPLLTGELKFPRSIDGSTTYGKEIYKEFIDIINAYSFQEKAWYIYIKASLLKILAILVENDLLINESKNVQTNNNYKVVIIKDILSYIRNNYKNKIYLSDLSELANMNEQYFCRFFKKAIGKTVVEYINEYRIEKAVELLQKEEIKILEVCYECGYDNVGYFIKKFKQYKGYTPSDYRKEIINN